MLRQTEACHPYIFLLRMFRQFSDGITGLADWEYFPIPEAADAHAMTEGQGRALQASLTRNRWSYGPRLFAAPIQALRESGFRHRDRPCHR